MAQQDILERHELNIIAATASIRELRHHLSREAVEEQADVHPNRSHWGTIAINLSTLIGHATQLREELDKRYGFGR